MGIGESTAEDECSRDAAKNAAHGVPTGNMMALEGRKTRRFEIRFSN